MNKNQWALHIGHFIIAMNEIDWMTHVCKQKVLKESLSKTWTKKTFADRLKSLCNKMTEHEDSSLLNELNTLLSETLNLCDFRNQIAHGSFIINCDKPMTDDPDSQLDIYTIGHPKTLTEDEIIEKCKNCREISNRISQQLAVISMSKMPELL